MQNREAIKKGIQSFLERLPNDQASHEAVFATLDSIMPVTQAYETQSVAPIIPSNFGLFNALSSITNATQAVSSLAASGFTIAWLYRNIENPNFIAGLAENGLFEILANNKALQTKTIQLIDSFVQHSAPHTKQQEKIIGLDTTLKLCEIQRHILAGHKVDPWQRAMTEFLPTNKDDLDSLETLLKERRAKLSKKIGSLATTMSHYQGLISDLNNSDLLKALLSAEKTTPGTPDHPISHLHHAYQKLDAFINNASSTNQKEMIMSFVELLTQQQVRTTLTPLATDKLVKDIFNLPVMTPEIKLYEPLIAHLAAKQSSFQQLFGAILTQKPEFTKIMGNVMDFVALPANLSPDNQELITKRKDMIMACVELLTQPELADKVNAFASQELVNDIFALPNIANNPNVKSYEPLVHQLAAQPQKFQEFFSSITTQGRELTAAIDGIMDFVYPPKGADQDKLSERMQLSLIELAKPEVVTALIPLIDQELLKAVFNLPALQSVEPQSKAITEEMRNIAEQTETKQLVIDQLAAHNISPELTEKIKNIQAITKSDSSIKPANKTEKQEASAVKTKIIHTIKTLAEHSNNLNQAVQENSKQLEPMLQTLIDSPHGGVLRNFHLDAKEVVDFLPKLCTKEGLDAVASYVEKPSVMRLINIFVQTNTLGFAAQHYVKSLIIKPKELKKEQQPIVGKQTKKLALTRNEQTSVARGL